MKILSRIDQTEIVVDTQQSVRYGIMLSGGLDSAVLLYLMLKDCPSADIQPFYIAKHDGSHNYIPGIVSHLEETFNTRIRKPIKVGTPDVPHTVVNQTGTREALYRYPDIRYIYLGINQNPPQPWGNPNWVFPVRPTENNHPRLVMPFMMLHKTHVVDILLQENQHELLRLTHTCTEQPKGRCGVCFQCGERAWAFEQLDAQDLGVD